MMVRLAYGLRDMPEVKAAWGARLIFPADFVYNRADRIGDDDDKAVLFDWLQNKAPTPSSDQFVNTVRQNTNASGENVFTVYEDETGIIRASAQGSGGYLYVSAWLKAHELSTSRNSSDGEPQRNEADLRAEALSSIVAKAHDTLGTETIEAVMFMEADTDACIRGAIVYTVNTTEGVRYNVHCFTIQLTRYNPVPGVDRYMIDRKSVDFHGGRYRHDRETAFRLATKRVAE